MTFKSLWSFVVVVRIGFVHRVHRGVEPVEVLPFLELVVEDIGVVDDDAAVGDAKVLGNLRDRLLAQPGELNSSTTEVGDEDEASGLRL